MDISLRCTCGAMRGVAVDLSPEVGRRLVCLCDDCQAYACFLEREKDVLDRFGGTDLFQTSPAHVRITEGHAHLRCVRLSAKGLHRFYAGCCRTPVGNTVGWWRVPFVGVVHTFMDHTARSRDDAFGPPLAHIQGKFAIGGPPAHAHPTAPPALLLGSLRWLLGASLRGAHRPSPFFDTSGRTVVAPRVLDVAERERLRARVAALA